jgi:hypothetical protein
VIAGISVYLIRKVGGNLDSNGQENVLLIAVPLTAPHMMQERVQLDSLQGTAPRKSSGVQRPHV